MSLETFIKLADERAILPSKAHPSDTGFDLTIIDVYKEYLRREDFLVEYPALVDNPLWTYLFTIGPVTLFETGVIIEPPEGIYYDMVPRSSLSKTGWIQANSVGIIDHHYRGTVKVPMMKIHPLSKPMDLPSTHVQIIPREIIPMKMTINQSMALDTDRGAGGFGSSNR